MIRFMYGLRAAGPVLIGHSGLSPWRFMFYNAIGAVIWAVLFVSLGWVFGQAAEQVLVKIDALGHDIFYVGAVVVLVVGTGIWLWNRRRAARLARQARRSE